MVVTFMDDLSVVEIALLPLLRWDRFPPIQLERSLQTAPKKPVGAGLW